VVDARMTETQYKALRHGAELFPGLVTIREPSEAAGNITIDIDLYGLLWAATRDGVAVLYYTEEVKFPEDPDEQVFESLRGGRELLRYENQCDNGEDTYLVGMRCEEPAATEKPPNLLLWADSEPRTAGKNLDIVLSLVLPQQSNQRFDDDRWCWWLPKTRKGRRVLGFTITTKAKFGSRPGDREMTAKCQIVRRFTRDVRTRESNGITQD